MFIWIQDQLHYAYIDLNDCSRSYEVEGLRFYYKEGWYLELGEDLFFIDHTKRKRLKLKMYLICQKEHYYKRQVYVFEKSEGLTSFAFYQKRSFMMNDTKEADLYFKNPYFKTYYLYFKDFKVYSNYPFIFYNRKLYRNETIQEGDEIVVLGFKMIVLKDALWMNHFMLESHLLKDEIKPIIYKAIPKEFYTVPYRHFKKIEALDIAKPEAPKLKKESDSFELYRQILPALSMSFAMVFVSLLNLYLNLKRGRVFLELLPFIILPITMLISSIVWPIIFYFLKKKRDLKANQALLIAYNLQKESYYTDLKQQLERIISILKDEYFDNQYYLKHIKEKCLFDHSIKDDDFLNISLGYIAFKDSKYYLEELETDIKEIPFLIDLKKHPYYTIIEDDKEDHYFIKKILLECIMKYHPDDIAIVFYKVEDPFFLSLSFSHLFYQYERLFIDKEEDFKPLNHLQKRLVIFAFKKLHYVSLPSDWIFIYVSNRDIQRLSEVIIQVKGGRGLIKEGLKEMTFYYKYEAFAFYEYIQSLSLFELYKDKKHRFGLKESFQVEHLDDLLPLKRVNTGLSAPIGLIDDEIFELNLDAKAHGPHGLIAGSTGSGKTELIVSILTSFALRYSSKDVGFIIIDFKGGMISERLSKDGKKIPHIYAEISNLNKQDERFLIALKYECEKRQRLFQEFSKRIGKPIMDLEDYRSLKDEKATNLAHLLIVVDEFAELKKNRPDFLSALISFARIGRSLGLHLILSTQKPSGVIDDEIWANTHFKIALKVLDEKDSKEVIKSEAAAFLKRPGEFYCLLDQDLIYVKSLYTRYSLNNDDLKLAYLNKRWQKIESYKKEGQALTELEYVLDTLIKEEKPNDFLINEKPVSKDIKALKEEYCLNDIVIGEYDNYPLMQKGPIVLDTFPILFVYFSLQMFLNYLSNDIPIIIIGKNAYHHPAISDYVYALDDLKYLYYRLKKDLNDVYLLIENVGQLLVYEEYAFYLYKILQDFQNLKVVAFGQSVLNIQNRFIHHFKKKIYIGNNPQEYFHIFDEAIKLEGDSYINLKEVLPCVMAKGRIIKDTKLFEPLLLKIPTFIKKKIIDHRILIGYDLEKREEVYLDLKKEYVVTAFDQNALIRFKEIFDEAIFKVEVYHSLKKQYYPNLIFISAGLFHQNLFFSKSKEDLKEGEALLVEGGVERRIKLCYG